MKCPECGFENIDKAKFCNQCGTRIEVQCLNCKTRNPVGSKFCFECGRSLAAPAPSKSPDLSFEEKISKIQKYLPEGLTEKILSQRNRIEGEKKQVTVLFCDMEGFTSLSGKLGHEEMYTLMDQVYEILIHKVHEYEGTVNELTGDGIMALFGAPIALEDAPQRAIRSALAIHREITRFNERETREKKIPAIRMRIGIHSGPVVVGTLGNDLRVDFKAVGETVNLASRMQTLAEPGTTYVTDETFKLTEGLFRFESLGERQVKGKETPLRVYQVIAPSTRRTRFDVNAERGLSPFVGRERELELMLDSFERVKAGRGQAFSIMSEAGLGKSRLLYEFRKAIGNEEVTFLEGKCLSYCRGVAYHPLIDVLKSNFNVMEGDSDSTIREKAIRGLKTLKVDEGPTLPYVLELLAVKQSGIETIPMSPEVRKERILEALKRITIQGSELRPLVIAIEDLHWMDMSSEDYLKTLLDSISGARVLLILSYRPEYVPTWGAKSYHNHITLNRLSNRESLGMVHHLLGTEDVERGLEEVILEKTEGIPFFIEEFIKSLEDLKVIEKSVHGYHLTKDALDVSIPSTIQDVIMARVDALPEKAREVLQTGSVIEREFSYELIKHVMGIPEQELLNYLSILKDAEVLYERGIYPQSTYIFRHALTKEVVYDSVLSRRRNQLHEQIGNAIENIYRDKIDNYYGILTEHFITSQNYEKGAKYSKLAARSSRKEFAYRDAISYSNKELFCVERLPKTPELQKRIIDARTAVANYCINLNLHAEAKEAVDPIIELALNINYGKSIPMIYNAIGSYYLLVEEDFQRGFEYLHIAANKAADERDYFSLFSANYFLGVGQSFDCQFEEGRGNLERALEIVKSGGQWAGVPIVMGTISGGVHLPLGAVNLAIKESEEGVRIAEKSGDIRTIGIAYHSLGYSCFIKGAFVEAKKHLLKGVSLCQKGAHFIWAGFASGTLGYTLSEMEEDSRAREYFNQGISLLDLNRNWPSMAQAWRIAGQRSAVLGGDMSIVIDDLLLLFNKIALKQYHGWSARHISEILLKLSDQYISESEEWIKRALETDRTYGLRWNLGQDYAVYAQLFRRKGDSQEARQTLIKAIDILAGCGADGWVAKYKKELDELS